MPVRDWDKLRRQDRAKKPKLYYKSSRPKRKRRHHRKGHLHGPYKQIAKPKAPQPKPPEPAVRWLEITLPDRITYATFKRKNRTWRCTQAEPWLEWFLRVYHVDIIKIWLTRNSYPFKWLFEPPCPHSLQSPGHDHNPADSYPLKYASVP